MLGWLSELLMAVSMTAIFSSRSLPDITAGNTMVLTATSVPRQVPAAGAGRGGAGRGGAVSSGRRGRSRSCCGNG
jgi:hypothetical protein